MQDLIVDQTLSIIHEFKIWCSKYDLQEENPVGLVSKHDPTIRFTNSTTSVLKPYIVIPSTIPGKGLFLVQPAMGLQGVKHWLKYEEFGCFSSYFLSFGTLSSIKDKELVVELALKFLLNYIDEKNLFLACHKNHLDKLENLNKLMSVNIITDMPEEEFIHMYGMDNIYGYDIQIGSVLTGVPKYFGNISIIWVNNLATCVEFSFDSSLLISAINRKHPVLCTPSFDVCSKIISSIDSDHQLAFIDFLELVSVLQLNGLKVGSRGRCGNFKQIYNTLVFLSLKLEISIDCFFYLLEQCISVERIIFNAISSNYSFNHCIKDDYENLKFSYKKAVKNFLHK